MTSHIYGRNKIAIL